MKCARRACNSENAVCRHTQTGRLYCPRCARKINEAVVRATPLVTFPSDRAEAQRILDQTGMTKQQQEAELAKQYDAKSEPDRLRGAGWCKYQLNGWFIWETPKDGKVVWAMARLTTDTTPAYFTDHWYTNGSTVADLEEAFKRAIL